MTPAAPGAPGRPEADLAAPRPQVAVGAVAVAGGALLLVRRGRPPETGRWSLPGGRVEAGETLAEAVVREVLEETGLAVRCGRFLGWVERIGPGHHFVILDFVVDPADGVAAALPPLTAGGDATAARWVRLPDVPATPLVSGLEAFLRDRGVLGPKPGA